jgi:hypothetical protein
MACGIQALKHGAAGAIYCVTLVDQFLDVSSQVKVSSGSSTGCTALSRTEPEEFAHCRDRIGGGPDPKFRLLSEEGADSFVDFSAVDLVAVDKEQRPDVVGPRPFCPRFGCGDGLV